MEQELQRKRISLWMCLVVLAIFASLSLIPAASAQDEPLKVAAILPGAINDQSWNSLGYAGMTAIAEQFGAEIAYTESVQPADQIDAIRDYVARGFDIIFVHGGQFEDAAITVAEEAPDVTFFVTAGAQGNGSNVIALDAARDEMMYGLGYLGALLSESGQLGYVTSLEGIPAIVSSVCGFRAGAAAGNPDVEVAVVYVPDMEDVARAREATLTLIGNGADYVVGDLNRGIQGVLDVAMEEGVMTTGRVPAHVEVYPDGVMTTAVEDWAAMYPSSVQQMMDGNLTGEPLFLGLNQGFFYAYGNAEESEDTEATPEANAEASLLNSSIPEDVAEAWTEAIGMVASGETVIEQPEGCDAAGTL